MPAPMALSRPLAFSSLIARQPLADELREQGLPPRAVAVVHEVEVVDDRDVVPGQAEPQLALLVGAHDPVVGVVEDDVEGRPAPSRATGRCPTRAPAP